MWTKITRLKYERDGERYASDLTDAEWTLIEPHMPAVKRLGRPRETELRAVLDAILYIARTGCQWRMLPKDFPPFTTVQGYFYDWRDDGLFEKINFALLLEAREAAGREPSPSAGVIDSQSVKTTESGGPRGYDAAKKVKGRKRHLVTDTGGLLVGAEVHPADIRRGAAQANRRRPVQHRGDLGRPPAQAARCDCRPRHGGSDPRGDGAYLWCTGTSRRRTPAADGDVLRPGWLYRALDPS